MNTPKIPLLILFVCLIFLPGMAIAETVLFQNFETPPGWNGDNLPNGWTITDNGIADGTWDNFDWFRFFAWGGYTARVNGANQNHYNNDWLISPTVNLGSATACTLFFRHYYDDVVSQTSDSALVLLSNNGGSTWDTTVVVYKGADFGADTVPDSEYFDISSFAAGHTAVKVAFQYLKTQAVVAGGWRLDDVKFRADGALVLHQDFESSWGPFGGNPPTNWAINDINVVRWDDNDWHQSTVTDWGNVAEVYWSPIEQQNEFLASDTIDFSVSTHAIRVSLKQFYDDRPDNPDTAMILGSINGGSTWPETLAVYQAADRGALTSPAYDTLDIFDWANNESNVKIGFRYVGNDDGRWYVDSLRVERIDNFNYDARAVAILGPPTSTIQSYSWPVSATVENAGLNTISFNVIMKITDSTGATVYNQTQSVSNVPSLTQRTVNFPSWLANEPNEHSIVCYTAFSGDQDRSNDSITSSTYVFPHVGSGGPVEGWAFKDNITGGGPAYQWIDIRSFGNEIGFSDPEDGNSGMIEMGMDFEYFWSHYHRIAVSVDGWLSFVDSTSSDNSHSAIPDADGPAGMIALLWRDLSLATGHVYYLFDSGANRFIVQYDSVDFSGVPGSDICMEIIFDGDDNTIKMQYRSFGSGTESDVTIGLENQAETIGLPYNNAGEPGQTPMPGMAVTYNYRLPHDAQILAIDQPTMLLHEGDTYDVVARFKNTGAVSESFNVTAMDNFGYGNTQTINSLAIDDSVTVTFPNWIITNACSTYALTVFTDLAGDLDRSNDTLFRELIATPAANVDYTNDNGYVSSAEYYEPDTILAAGFRVFYGNAVISAIAFRFTNLDVLPDWPDSTRDSVAVYLFNDLDNDSRPDPLPSYSSKILASGTGWTIWNVACETTITISCGSFWAGFTTIPSQGLEAVCLDNDGFDNPNTKWMFDGTVWQIDSAWPGDLMIRAYLDCDSSTAPNLSPETYLISSAVAPHGVDTVSTYIQNTGAACSLYYEVTVLQTIIPRSLGQFSDPAAPPIPLSGGGPDIYGYTWIDSDEPTGPDYYWLDISSVGTEVDWDYGDADDGHTNPIPMGMTFSFYGANCDSIAISSNGFASFMRLYEEPLAFSENNPVPIADIRTILAVDWDNLDGGTAGHCYYYHDIAANSFIVSWVDWSHKPAPTDQHSFQIVLNATDGTIIYQYAGGSYQNDITIGIGNEDGDDGLMVTYNQPYVHPNLAILFSPPIFWLRTDLPDGRLPANSAPEYFNIFMYARDLPTGVYNGAIVLKSNDVDQPVSQINVQFEIEGICAYIPGDVNSSGSANGIDVTFMVNYFKGGSAPHEECPACSSLGVGMLYPQGDVNGNCAFNGIDVVYFVAYLKGIGQPIRYCDSCAPAGGGGLVGPGPEKPSIIPISIPRNKIQRILR